MEGSDSESSVLKEISTSMAKAELIAGYLTGITGEYATPRGYFVDEAECEMFDRQFPPKQKLKLPGQLW